MRPPLPVLALVLTACGTPMPGPVAVGEGGAAETATLAESGSATVTESGAAAESETVTVSGTVTESGTATATVTESGTAAESVTESVTVPEAPPRYRPARASRSTSTGGPSSGALEGGVALPERAAGLLSNPRRPNPTAFYGTAELINALVRAAAVVDRELPGGTLTVNDIGFERGGPIDHHGSHQAGRDADVLFYLLDAEGRPRPSVGAPIDPEGQGTDYRDLMDPADDEPLRIDLPRTWRFVQALLADEAALVQRIFVVEHVRTMLLAEARRQRAPADLVARFADVTCQPSYAHDDHLHIRLFCTTEDLAAGCADGAPMYPWRLAQLEAAGVAPVAEERPRRRRSRVVTEEEARANAPPMHESVRAFLDRRESWIAQPHPGRRWCR